MNMLSLRLPVSASREKIHKGDEARVTRISCANPFFNGLVERKEKLGYASTYEKRYLFARLGRLGVGPASDSENGQAMRYYFLRLSHTLYPSNFPRARALRFLEENGRSYGLLYSEPVPDEAGCLPRKEKYFQDMQKIAKKAREGGDLIDLSFDRGVVRDEYDWGERIICPAMVIFGIVAKKAGILFVHPEANYYVSSGEPVFFEPMTIDLGLALSEAHALGGKRKEKALLYIGLIGYVALSESISRLKGNGKFQEGWSSLAKLVESRDSAFMRAFLKLVKEEPDFAKLVGSSNESYVKFVAERLAF